MPERLEFRRNLMLLKEALNDRTEEEVQLERRVLEYVFSAGDTCTFMSFETFEQVEVPTGVVGPAEKFLQPGMQLPVEFYEGEPLKVAFPEVVEVRVAETAPPAHAQQETAWKEARLENGLSVQVPMFVATGEVVRLEVRTGHYIERVRAERKRGASGDILPRQAKEEPCLR